MGIEEELWGGITETDFNDDLNVVEEDIGEYDLEKMKIFSANINYFRQIPRLSDSLKPVERRILYSMYMSGARPGNKTQKSSKAIGNAMMYHAHGDISLYKTMVGMAQLWKRAIPLVYVKGNCGSEVSDLFAHYRYTEVLLTKYSYECFFDDFDEDCIETIFNTSVDGPEPLSLPAKFPNILVNGGTGIAIGNSFTIPPYNVYDVIDVCKKLMKDPNDSNIFIYPDLPTGVPIVDDGIGIREIAENGSGTLRMKSTIEIEEGNKVWILRVRNIPWMTSLESIDNKLTELTKKGTLPIKDLQNKSYQTINKQDNTVKTVIDYHIIIDKAHDPNSIKNKLYKITELGKSLAVNFKVVLEGPSINKMNLRDLILSWLDERREYKRRLFNKKVNKLSARISLLEILIYLLSKDNIEKTVQIIKNSNSNEIVDRLVKHGNMTSFQASKISDMKLSAFSKDARERYINEKIKLERDLEETLDIIKSEKKIDKIISGELDDLRKYGSPRKSKIITADTGIHISDSNHNIIATNQGYIKKLRYTPYAQGKMPALGVFKSGDYPIMRLIINNLDIVYIFDSFGKFSAVPVHEIENTEHSNIGHRLYDIAKLNGEIISLFPRFKPETEKYINENLGEAISLITLTKKGFLKKTPLSEFESLKSTKNIRAMKIKEGDALIYANIIMDSSDIIIYTKNGKYTFLSASDIPVQVKTTMGLSGISIDDGDECVGLNVIGKDERYIVVVTEKGNVKLVETEYMNLRSKRGTSTYLISLDENDEVYYVNGVDMGKTLLICSRVSYYELPINNIPILSRKAKGQKHIPLGNGNNIIGIDIIDKR